jgi:hypothetical protein
MDRASQVLAQHPYPDMPKIYATLAECGNVPYTTVWHRAHGRPSQEERAQRQQYLNPFEEKSLLSFCYNGLDSETQCE